MATSKNTSTRAKQFPAKAGDATGEVAERSADGSDATRYVKEFVVLAREWAGTDAQHEANTVAVLSEAIQRGLHPRGDVACDGTQDHPDGQSLTLTYSVETVPASVDHLPQDATTPREVLTDGAEG